MNEPNQTRKNIKVKYGDKEEILTPNEFDRRLLLGLLPVIVSSDIYEEMS